MPVRRGVAFAALAIVLSAATWGFRSDRAMSAVWYGPYLSAAVNLKWGGPFLYSLEETKAFRELSHDERLQYRFHVTDPVQTYNHNPIGYAYFIALAKKVFFWLPDVPAVQAMQALLHVLLCLGVTTALPSIGKRTGFLLLYALNPLVLYYVTFPFYYFLQAIPSFALVALLVRGKNGYRGLDRSAVILFVLLGAILGLVVLTRPTTIFAAVASLVLVIRRVRPLPWVAAAIAAFLLVTITGHSPSQKNVWHTAYIGIGAYSNTYMKGLSDDNGYHLYESVTGDPLVASLGGNYYDPDTMERYIQITRAEYLRILRADSWLLLRNAVTNTAQGFSIGYLVDAPLPVNYAIAISGFLVALFLVIGQQFIIVFLVLLTIGGFSPIYPPIPAYMYGAYLLLVIGALDAVAKLMGRLRKAR